MERGKKAVTKRMRHHIVLLMCDERKLGLIGTENVNTLMIDSDFPWSRSYVIENKSQTTCRQWARRNMEMFRSRWKKFVLWYNFESYVSVWVIENKKKHGRLKNLSINDVCRIEFWCQPSTGPLTLSSPLPSLFLSLFLTHTMNAIP